MEPPRNDYQQTLSEEERSASILVKWIVAFISYVRRVYALSDVGAGVLLKFFVALFGVLGKIFPPLSLVFQYLPTSLQITVLIWEIKAVS